MISRRIFAVAALFCAFIGSVHAQTGSPKTSVQLNTEINSRFPSTGKQQITAFDLRQVTLDLVASVPFLTNTLNSQTANYTIASTDCGKIIQAGTGSTGLFTVTLPPISGFAANCSVTVKNGDTARGKVLSGFPADLLSNILWPTQALQVAIVNGAWVTLVNPGKWILPSDTTINVNHASGSDVNNDCLGTVGGACATIQNAANVIKGNFTCGQFQPTVQVAAETFTESVVIVGGAQCDGIHPDLIIRGTPGAPSSTVWQTAGTGLTAVDHAVIIVDGFKFVGTGSTNIAIQGYQQAFVSFGNIDFGTFTAGTHLSAFAQSIFVYEGGTYTISGNVATHINLSRNSTINFANGPVISIPGALTFSSVWITVAQNSSADFSVTSFTGAGAGAGSTGSKYFVNLNSSLFLNGVVLPGNAGGSATTGGQVL